VIDEKETQDDEDGEEEDEEEEVSLEILRYCGQADRLGIVY
jgi:hypothetical protein